MLEVTGVSLAYGQVQAIQEVSITVHDRACVAILGRNGAGKSSLLRAITGFSAISRGSITFDGVDLTPLPPHARGQAGRGLCHGGTPGLPQPDRRRQPPTGRVRPPPSSADVDSTARNVLERFPVLATKAKMPTSTLSGGEQQMLAVAQALMAVPKLLLLDEASADSHRCSPVSSSKRSTR